MNAKRASGAKAQQKRLLFAPAPYYSRQPRRRRGSDVDFVPIARWRESATGNAGGSTAKRINKKNGAVCVCCTNLRSRPAGRGPGDDGARPFAGLCVCVRGRPLCVRVSVCVCAQVCVVRVCVCEGVCSGWCAVVLRAAIRTGVCGIIEHSPLAVLCRQKRPICGGCYNKGLSNRCT